MKFFLGITLFFALTILSGCFENPNCEEACIEDGKCIEKVNMFGTGAECSVGSGADCEQSNNCSFEGRCKLQDGECVHGSDEDCAKSSNCIFDGACSFVHGHCVPSADIHCSESELCQQKDLCGAAQNRCWIKADTKLGCTDKRKHENETFSPCDEFGWCSLVDGLCMAETAEDCLQLPWCKDYEGTPETCFVESGLCCQDFGDEYYDDGPSSLYTWDGCFF